MRLRVGARPGDLEVDAGEDFATLAAHIAHLAGPGGIGRVHLRRRAGGGPGEMPVRAVWRSLGHDGDVIVLVVRPGPDNRNRRAEGRFGRRRQRDLCGDDLDGAAREDLVAAFVLGRNVARDGTLISTLVQLAMEAIDCWTVAELFGQFST